jgi:hypothetical protein
MKKEITKIFKYKLSEGEGVLINNKPYKVCKCRKFLFWFFIVFQKDFFKEGEF